MDVLIQHIPHAVPVVIVWGLMLRFWLDERRRNPADEDQVAREPALAAAAAAAAPSSTAAAPVRRSVALRGLIALGPLIGALATGIVIYAVNLGQGHAGAAAIWAHTGLSLLALLLVAYKIAEIGFARMREVATRHGAWRSAGSVVLLALWVPLLVSGVALLIFPSEASFTAYAHLIASVWWTGLLLWHLRRYLIRATRTVLARPSRRPEPATAAQRYPPASNAGPGRRGPQPAVEHRGPSRARRIDSASLPTGEPGVATEDGVTAPVHRG